MQEKSDKSSQILYEERKKQYMGEINELVSNQQNDDAGPHGFETLQKHAKLLTKNDEDASHFIAMEAYRQLFLANERL